MADVLSAGGDGMGTVPSSEGGPQTEISEPQQQMLQFPILASSWTAEESKLLDDGILKFPSEKYPPIVRYAKIAAMISTRDIRDIAIKCNALTKEAAEKKKVVEGNLSHNLHLYQKKEGGKKKKADDALLAKREKVKRERTNEMPLMLKQASLPMIQPAPPADGMDGRTAEMLQENEHLFNQIRSNHAQRRISESSDMFLRIRDNVHSILNGMTTMPGIMQQMPPLPVKLNLDQLNSILPKPMGPPPVPMHHMTVIH